MSRYDENDKYNVLRMLLTNFMEWSAEAPPKVQKLPLEELDTEFKREFPPDVFGHEMDESARVWKVYPAHATRHDDALLDGWNETINILLVFAGLFSAVVTAFLIESYKTLQFDNEAYIATALHMILVTNVNGTGRTMLPDPPPLSTSPSLVARWINGLWFMSLFLALAVSLLSILIKQWLREYKARNDASAQSPRHWARRRGFLFDALTSWRIAEFISLLPVLLHVALFLFLIGTVLFLWTLDKTIGIVIVVTGSALALFYTASIAIPLWRPECPTSTPLVNLIRISQVSIQIGAIRAFAKLCELYRRVLAIVELNAQRGCAWLQSLAVSTLLALLLHRCAMSVARTLDGLRHDPIVDVEHTATTSRLQFRRISDAMYIPTPVRRSFTALLAILRANMLRLRAGGEHAFSTEVLHSKVERLNRQKTDQSLILPQLLLHSDYLDAAVLKWLITIVSETDAVAVAVQGLGAIRPSSRLANLIRSDSVVSGSAAAAPFFTRSPGEPSTAEIARVARSLLFLGELPSEYLDKWPWLDRLQSAEYPDCDFLASAVHISRPFYTDGNMNKRDPRIYIASDTCTQTCMLLLYRYGSHALCLLPYCALDSVNIDWDIIVNAASDDGPSAGASAVSACCALVRRVMGRKGDFTPERVLEIAATILALLPLICRKNLDRDSLDAKLGIVDISDSNPLHVYAPFKSELLRFFGTNAFQWTNLSYADLDRVLAILQFFICRALDGGEYDEAQDALRSLASVLGWAGHAKQADYSSKCAALLISFLPRRYQLQGRVERLSLLLLPLVHDSPRTSVWQIIAQYRHEHWLRPAVHIVASAVDELQRRHPPGRPDLADALFDGFPFMDLVYHPNGPQNRIFLFRVFYIYSHLCPEKWAKDRREALARGDESIRNFVDSFEHPHRDPLLLPESDDPFSPPDLYR